MDAKQLEDIRTTLVMRRGKLFGGEVRMLWNDVADLVDEVDRLRKELNRIDRNARVGLSEDGDIAAGTCVDPVYVLCCTLAGLRGDTDRLRAKVAELEAEIAAAGPGPFSRWAKD